MSKEEIALQLTLKVIERTSFNSFDEVKKHPYEIYNSIYDNIKTKNSNPVDVLK